MGNNIGNYGNTVGGGSGVGAPDIDPYVPGSGTGLNDNMVWTGGTPPPGGTGLYGGGGGLPPPDWNDATDQLSPQLLQSITDPATLFMLASSLLSASQMKSHIALKQSYVEELKEAMAQALQENKDEIDAANAGFAAEQAKGIGGIVGGTLQIGVAGAGGAATYRAKISSKAANTASEKSSEIKTKMQDGQKSFEAESKKLKKNLHDADIKITEHEVNKFTKRSEATKADLKKLQDKHRDHVERRDQLADAAERETYNITHIKPLEEQIAGKQSQVEHESDELEQGNAYLDRQREEEPADPVNLKGDVKQTKQDLEGLQKKVEENETASNQLKQQAFLADPEAAAGLVQRFQEHDSAIADLKPEIGLHQEKLDALTGLETHIKTGRDDFIKMRDDLGKELDVTQREEQKHSGEANVHNQVAMNLGQLAQGMGQFASDSGNLAAASQDQTQALKTAEAKLDGAYEQNLAGVAQMYLDASNNASAAFDKNQESINTVIQQVNATNSGIFRNTPV
jgi:hypothetical protein